MPRIERISFSDSLPESFFTIPVSIYASLPFNKPEGRERILKLFIEESKRNEIIIYTNHESIRLVGIFSKSGGEVYFGFWETVDDLKLNAEAFEYFQEDARKRNLSKIVGPINFSTYQSYRLRLSDPSWIKFDQEPVNPLYYPTILTDLGFDKEMLFESRMIKKADIPEIYSVKENSLKALKNISFESIPITPETWEKYEEEIFELVQAIFSANPLYKSISHKQFTSLYNSGFASKLCPYSSVFFKGKPTGRLVSLSFCHPNYELLKFQGDHHYSYENDFKKLNHKTLLVKSVGVHPDFRKQGLMNFMAAHAMLSFQELYDDVIFCMTRADNISNNFTRHLPYEKVAYTLFTKFLP
jgi:hypothetical protein